MTDYFIDLLASHSWSSVKLDLYGLKFYYTHVLRKPWVAPNLIKPPKAQSLPDIVTVEGAQRLFLCTRTLSYSVFFFTVYSLGLRLGEGLRLQVGDIDTERQRVHIRDAKGNKDRLVPLPAATLDGLRRFWQVHRNPVLRFPHRHGGLNGAGRATTPLDRGGVQTTLRKVAEDCGLKKRSALTVCGIATHKGVIQEKDIVACRNGQISFRYQDSKTRQMRPRTLPGTQFLWLILRHVLPKGFRRARNFGFLHPNSTRLIGLLQYLLGVNPNKALAWLRIRPSLKCRCCGGAMSIIRTRIPPPFATGTQSPPANQVQMEQVM